MTQERVQKWIAMSGLCSRRKAEDLIVQNKVKINGKIISLGDKCYPTDKITVNNQLIKLTNNMQYIIMNKAKGFITTKSDELSRKTVYNLLSNKDNISGLFSVGRLDKETTGLLILTNDGQFTQSIIHPSKKISKEYIAVLNKTLNLNDKIKIEKGIFLDKIKLAPCQIKEILENKYLIKIWEGRKRQIRRMFEMFDYEILNLHRIKIGNLDLKKYNLKYGEYKFVSKQELEKNIFSKNNKT